MFPSDESYMYIKCTKINGITENLKAQFLHVSCIMYLLEHYVFFTLVFFQQHDLYNVFFWL